MDDYKFFSFNAICKNNDSLSVLKQVIIQIVIKTTKKQSDADTKLDCVAIAQKVLAKTLANDHNFAATVSEIKIKNFRKTTEQSYLKWMKYHSNLVNPCN